MNSYCVLGEVIGKDNQEIEIDCTVWNMIKVNEEVEELENSLIVGVYANDLIINDFKRIVNEQVKRHRIKNT